MILIGQCYGIQSNFNFIQDIFSEINWCWLLSCNTKGLPPNFVSKIRLILKVKFWDNPLIVIN